MGVFLLLFQAHMRNMLVGWLVRRLLALSCAAFVPSPSFLVVVRCARLLLPLCFGLRSFCWCLGLPTFFAPLFLLRASDLFCGLFVRFCQHLSVVCPVLRCFWLTQTSPSGYVPCCLQQRGWALFGRSVTSLPSFKWHSFKWPFLPCSVMVLFTVGALLALRWRARSVFCLAGCPVLVLGSCVCGGSCAAQRAHLAELHLRVPFWFLGRVQQGSRPWGLQVLCVSLWFLFRVCFVELLRMHGISPLTWAF